MKTITGVLMFAALSLAAPLHAQTTEPQQAGTTASTDAKPKPAETKKAETPKKPKVAKTQGPAAVNYDGTTVTGEPKEKKVVTRHSNSMPVEKQGGKTCSGRDEYRVCW